MNFILIATAWGPKFGGINAFNMDFAKGLASLLGQNGKVFCGVLHATDAEVDVAKKDANVTLLHINKQNHENEFNSGSAYDFIAKFQNSFPGDTLDYWVGHDVISGNVAVSGSKLTNTKSALIMHMNYEAYQSFKSGVGLDAHNKTESQRETFKNADYLFANGPYLEKALSKLVDRFVTRLVPGFPDIKVQTITDEIRAITFGRLDQRNDNIKQGLLAVAGFASAVKDIHESLSATPFLKDMEKQIRVFGISEPGGLDEKKYRKTARDRAGGEINIIPIPFDDDRERMFRALGQANIALMVSWHEGFGLTGWESIAAEVPLILSKNSGLWLLIKEQFICQELAEAYVRLVNVCAQDGSDESDSFTKEDEDCVRNAVLGIATRLDARLMLARELKEILQNKLVCTWEGTAKAFLGGLGISLSHETDHLEKNLVGRWTAHYIEGSMGSAPKIVSRANRLVRFCS